MPPTFRKPRKVGQPFLGWCKRDQKLRWAQLPLFEGRQKLCCVRLSAFYLTLGLKPIVQVMTVCAAALQVKFVGALPNALVNRDHDSHPVRLRREG